MSAVWMQVWRGRDCDGEVSLLTIYAGGCSDDYPDMLYVCWTPMDGLLRFHIAYGKADSSNLWYYCACGRFRCYFDAMDCRCGS